MKKRIVTIIVCALMLVCVNGCQAGDSFKQGFQDGMNSAVEEANEGDIDDTEQQD